MALALPPDERVALATELLDSVEVPDDAEWTAAWREELSRRLEAFEHGTSKSVPWDELRAELRERYGAR